MRGQVGMTKLKHQSNTSYFSYDLNILEISKIYLNFITNFWKKIISRRIPETSKVLWQISVINLLLKRDDASVSWTHQQYRYETMSEGDTRNLMTSSKWYLKQNFKKKNLIRCCFGLFWLAPNGSTWRASTCSSRANREQQWCHFWKSN